MVRRFALLLLALGGLYGPPALACAMMEEASPKVGASVKGPVTVVTLRFSGKIIPAKSTLEVSDAGGHAVTVGKTYGTDTMLAIKVSASSPGVYKVHWNTYCDCKSYMPGHYRFTVE